MAESIPEFHGGLPSDSSCARAESETHGIPIDRIRATEHTNGNHAVPHKSPTKSAVSGRWQALVRLLLALALMVASWAMFGLSTAVGEHSEALRKQTDSLNQFTAILQVKEFFPRKGDK